MKVAIVHDYIKEYGGAERVLETLKEVFPDAHIYTLVYLPQFLGPHKERFIKWQVTPSFLQYIPFREKLISPFRLLAPLVFKTFNFYSYDVIITSATGAYNPNIIRVKRAGSKGKNQKLICYCHTPPRYLYGYPTARVLSKNPVIKVITAIANHFLRIVDFTSAKNVDQFIANSNEVKSRIKKFYRKEAVVIYPPVNMQNQSRVKNQDEKKYYLAGGRLARPKHIDIIIKAANELKLPLKVFGKSFAGYGDELGKLAGSTVNLLGEVSDEQKSELLQNARAFIFAAEDEDFGIMPVEAMAAGTPVIAYRSGGVQETVIDAKTGLFFDELSVTSLIATIKKFEKTNISSQACQKRAVEFSKERFKKQIKELVEKVAIL